MNLEPHPDAAQDYYRLKSIEKGGKQAIETAAMNAMWDALERGESKQEAEKIFFSFFNKQSHERQKQHTSIPNTNMGSITIG